jgi:hypothetical protein
LYFEQWCVLYVVENKYHITAAGIDYQLLTTQAVRHPLCSFHQRQISQSPPPPLFSQSYRLEAETGLFSIPHLLPFVNFLSRIFWGPLLGRRLLTTVGQSPDRTPVDTVGQFPSSKHEEKYKFCPALQVGFRSVSEDEI